MGGRFPLGQVTNLSVRLGIRSRRRYVIARRAMLLLLTFNFLILTFYFLFYTASRPRTCTTRVRRSSLLKGLVK